MRASSGYLRCLGARFRGNDDGATEHAADFALVWVSLRNPREGGDPGSANYWCAERCKNTRTWALTRVANF